MIKIIIACCCIMLMNKSVKAQNVPDFQMLSIEGDTMRSIQFSGKRIVLVVLPAITSDSATALLLNIDSTYRQYSDSNTAFIGISSFEEGYADSLKTALMGWYRDTLHLGFIITEGLYTHTSSGAQQHDLLKWISNAVLNGHFTIDINNSGVKFLLNESGELTAVFDESTMLTSSLMTLVLHPLSN